MKEPIQVLLAEDDDDDFLLAKKALKEVAPDYRIHRVKDGEELMRYLLGPREPWEPQPFTGAFLVLLDLNLPRKDGWEALREIRSHAATQGVPVVIFTTSNAERDIHRAYEVGANSFLRKPDTFSGWLQTMRSLNRYWFDLVELPQE